MTAQRAVPRFPDVEVETANNRFKGHFRAIFWSSMIVAVFVHLGVFEFWPELTADDVSFVAAELTTVALPPEVEIPPAPRAIARPATPVIATTALSEEITIAPTTFESNPIDRLPPPPEDKAPVRDLSDAPTFTPFTVAPEILNREELVDAMLKAYPPILRDAGIGGIVQVYFFIDRDGLVQTTKLHASSGYAQLDQAALDLAGVYRFSPALNRDQRVPVWVSFPVSFQVVR